MNVEIKHNWRQFLNKFKRPPPNVPFADLEKRMKIMDDPLIILPTCML